MRRVEAWSPDLPVFYKQAFRQRASLDRRRKQEEILREGGKMSWEKTKCYLCEADAEELEYSGNLRVRCDNCETFYYLTSNVRHFRLKDNLLVHKNPETYEKTPLSKIQKEKLLKLVQENNDPEGRSPVEINMYLIGRL